MKIKSVFILLLAVFFTISCAQNNSTSNSSDLIKVTVSTNFSNSTGNRAVLPESNYDDDELYSHYPIGFFLYGTNEDGEENLIEEVNNITYKELQEVEFYAERGNWTFTLELKYLIDDYYDEELGDYIFEYETIASSTIAKNISDRNSNLVFEMTNLPVDLRGRVQYTFTVSEDIAGIFRDMFISDNYSVLLRDLFTDEELPCSYINDEKETEIKYRLYLEDDSYILELYEVPAGKYLLSVDVYDYYYDDYLQENSVKNSTTIITDFVSVLPIITSVNTTPIEVSALNKIISLNYEYIFDENGTMSLGGTIDFEIEGETLPLNYNVYETVTIDAPKYTLEGYDFDGWYFISTEKLDDFIMADNPASEFDDYFIKLDQDDDGNYVFNNDYSGEITRVFAKYNPKEVEISFDLNGGSFVEGFVPETKGIYSYEYTLPGIEQYINNKYELLEWVVGPSSDHYNPGDRIIIDSIENISICTVIIPKGYTAEVGIYDQDNSGVYDFDYKDQIELTCSTENSTIYYYVQVLEDGDSVIDWGTSEWEEKKSELFVEYTDPITLDFGEEFKIYAYAESDYLVDSNISVFEIHLMNKTVNEAEIKFEPIEALNSSVYLVMTMAGDEYSLARNVEIQAISNKGYKYEKIIWEINDETLELNEGNEETIHFEATSVVQYKISFLGITADGVIEDVTYIFSYFAKTMPIW